jgi:hypothetical protein
MQEVRVCPSCEYEITSTPTTNCPRCGFNLDHVSDKVYSVDYRTARRENQRVRRQWIWKWVRVIALGFSVPGALSLMLCIWLARGDTLGQAVYFGVSGVLIGAFVGVQQLRVLRHWVSQAGWWVLASVVGFSTQALISTLLTIGELGSFVLGACAGGTLGGTLLGVLQWFILRKQVSRAGWWVLANSVGWSVGWTSLWAGTWALVDAGSGGGYSLEAAVISVLMAAPVCAVVGGVLAGAITGTTLIWMLRLYTSEPPSSVQSAA